MHIFILEDELYREPRNAILEVLSGHKITAATNVTAAKRIYPMGEPYDLLLLDHDMHGYYEDSSHPNTGYQFSRWLVETQKKVEVFLHSQHWQGRKNMRELFNAHGWLVHEHSFGPIYLEFLASFIKGR